MTNNWYDTNCADDWYSVPAAYISQSQININKKRSDKRTTRFRIIGICALVLILVVASSLIFNIGDAGDYFPFSFFSKDKSGNGSDSGIYNDGNDSVGEFNPESELPDSMEDFFAQFYTGVETEIAQIDIAKYPLKIQFRLSLESTPENELELWELYDRCFPTIVSIAAYAGTDLSYSWGTGVILSSDGLVLTNTHVVDGSNKVIVTTFDDKEYEAQLVGADSISDIAILKIDAQNLIAAEFGNSAELKVGQRVAAIGNPLGESFRATLTDGIISGIERGVNFNGRTLTLLQTNTAINEGNSGGPLFNLYGQVIGITNMKMMSSYSSIEGIGFAIPSAFAQSVINSILEDGEYRGRTSIGITVGEIPESIRAQYNIPGGLYISDVEKKSDAFVKGVRKDDILTAVNGIPVSTTADVSAIKDQFAVGDILVLSIWRKGENIDFEVALIDTLDLYK